MRELDESEQTEEQEDGNELATPARLTRKLVADRLGVSVFKVRSMEGKTLHPVREDGVHYFDPDEVAAAARSLGPRRGRRERTDGEVAALAFRAFSDGKDLHEVVEELVLAPEKVRALYREWREPDLEQHEVNRRRRARAEAEQKREEEDLRRQERDMEHWERQLARLGKQP
jgi:hypothetical protein